MIHPQRQPQDPRVRGLFEYEDDPDYNAAEDFYKRRDEELYDLSVLLKKSGGKGRVPWKTVSASLLKRVWYAFGKYNRIKENDIDKIADQVLTNIARLQASTEMMGHTSHDVRPEIEDNYGITFTDEEWDRWMSDYFTGKDGGWLLSDYGLEPLKKLYAVIFNARTPEEKLYAVDKALNVVHRRGDLASMFVEGGVSTLNAVANQGGYAYAGNYGDVNRESLVREDQSVAGKTFMVVDVQPEYQRAMPSNMVRELVKFITEHYEEMGQLVFLYNGAETLDMIDETSYKMWWIENGLDEMIVDQADFYDKGYAFFRYCMDSGGSEDATANFVRFMYENDIRDSRDMTREMWAKYLREYRRIDRKEIMDLLRHQSDCVHIPDLMDYLRRYTNLVICGGGINECLKEVEIALKALRKPYEVMDAFTY